ASAYSASCSVTGTRRARMAPIGSRSASDRPPHSPSTSDHIQRPYCTGSGSRRPNACRYCSTCPSAPRGIPSPPTLPSPPLPAQDHQRHIPGQRAHDQERRERCQQHRRDEQDQASQDVLLHYALGRIENSKGKMQKSKRELTQTELASLTNSPWF